MATETDNKGKAPQPDKPKELRPEEHEITGFSRSLIVDAIKTFPLQLESIYVLYKNQSAPLDSHDLRIESHKNYTYASFHFYFEGGDFFRSDKELPLLKKQLKKAQPGSIDLNGYGINGCERIKNKLFQIIGSNFEPVAFIIRAAGREMERKPFAGCHERIGKFLLNMEGATKKEREKLEEYLQNLSERNKELQETK